MQLEKNQIIPMKVHKNAQLLVYSLIPGVLCMASDGLHNFKKSYDLLIELICGNVNNSKRKVGTDKPNISLETSQTWVVFKA